MEWREVSNDHIDEAFAHFGGLTSAGQAKVCELIREVDARQSWMTDGARNLVDWVAARINVRPGTARQLVHVARRLIDLPVITESFGRGELSLDQVDAISRMATADTEQELIEEVLGLSNASLDRAARRANPPSLEDERTVWKRRRLVRQWNLDESELSFHGNLPAAEGELFDEAIDARVGRIPPNPETGMFDAYVTRSADALIELCATTGDETTVTPPQITVNADLEALTTETGGVVELSSGALVPNETARRLCCDAVVETVITDGSQVVGIGGNSRTVPGWLRRLVYHRDHSQCRFSGCSNTRWLQVHHIQHWSQGGKTNLDNLILLCGFHHRFVHEHHWHVTTDTQGRFQFRRPDWTLHPQPRPDLHPRLKKLVGAGRPT